MVQFHRDSNNCFQDILAMILLNDNKDPFDIYQGCLNFGYNKKEVLYGNRLTLVLCQDLVQNKMRGSGS